MDFPVIFAYIVPPKFPQTSWNHPKSFWTICVKFSSKRINFSLKLAHFSYKFSPLFRDFPHDFSSQSPKQRITKIFTLPRENSTTSTKLSLPQHPKLSCISRLDFHHQFEAPFWTIWARKFSLSPPFTARRRLMLPYLWEVKWGKAEKKTSHLENANPASVILRTNTHAHALVCVLFGAKSCQKSCASGSGRGGKAKGREFSFSFSSLWCVRVIGPHQYSWEEEKHV